MPVDEAADDDVMEKPFPSQKQGKTLGYREQPRFKERVEKFVDDSLSKEANGGKARDDDENSYNQSPKRVHGSVLKLVEERVVPVTDSLDLFDYLTDGAPALFPAGNAGFGSVPSGERDPGGAGFRETVQQTADSLSGHCDRRDDWNAEQSFQRLGIDVNSLVAGFVDHIERDDNRQAPLHRLEGEKEVAFQGRRVENKHGNIRSLVDHSFRYFLGFVRRRERVRSGNVDYTPHIAAPAKPAFQESNGRAGVV